MVARRNYDSGSGEFDWREMMDPESEEYDPGFVSVEAENKRVAKLRQEIYDFARMLSDQGRKEFGFAAREPSDVDEVLSDFVAEIEGASESEKDMQELQKALAHARSFQKENAVQYLKEVVVWYGSELSKGRIGGAEDIARDLEFRTFWFLEHSDIGVDTAEIEKTKVALERYAREPKLYRVDALVGLLQKDINAITGFFAAIARHREGPRSFGGSADVSVTYSEDNYGMWERTVDIGTLTQTIQELQEVVHDITDTEAYTEAQQMLEFYYQKVLDIPAIQSFFELLGSYAQDIQSGNIDTDQKQEVYTRLRSQVEAVKDPDFAADMWHELFLVSVIFGVPKAVEKKYQSDFTLLGVHEGATDQELKTAYRELSKQHHPDKHTREPESVQIFHEEKFKEITAAYERLTKNG